MSRHYQTRKYLLKFPMIVLSAMFLAVGNSAYAAAGVHPPISTNTKLAIASQNLIENLTSIQFEFDNNFNLGDFDRRQNLLLVKPIYPFLFSNGWSLVPRIIFNVFLPQPVVTQAQGEKYGFGDINPEFFIAPQPTKNFMVGFGPSIVIPTASDKILGAGKWSAGPIFYINIKHQHIVFGVLTSQIWSFAGQSSRKEVSFFSFNPFFEYNFNDGWYIFTNPLITGDWKLSSGNKWLVPMGGGIGKVFQLGSQHMKCTAAAYYNVVTPDLGPEWQAQITLTLLFPNMPQ